MVRMETAAFRWKIKWRLEQLGALRIMGDVSHVSFRYNTAADNKLARNASWILYLMFAYYFENLDNKLQIYLQGNLLANSKPQKNIQECSGDEADPGSSIEPTSSRWLEKDHKEVAK